jgi:hypothetical protein
MTKYREAFILNRHFALVIGVGYDSVDKRVYWTDVRLGKESIESVKTDGRGRRVVLNSGLGMPEDLVVDETSRNIYFR